ncbi:hypothetical protein [Planctomonas psychrotolerans]|uniref:hypothetical protein n=1 Tax=Planctomonas psychrotolerans TaxID=2528712 RepID=UPI001239C084|nr:hypothetical protein [Planctomonas psychrotolerans]
MTTSFGPDDPDDRPDPTLMRNQAALTTASGRSWLILGGILAAVSVGTLAFFVDAEPTGLALYGIATVVVLYAGMVGARLAVPRGPKRLRLLAVLMILIAIVGLGCVLVLAMTGSAALTAVST